MNDYLAYRARATELVEPCVYRYGQFACVGLTQACKLLGSTYYQKMMADKVRNLGALPGTIYPWNVIDYLSMRLQCEDQETVS